MPNVSLPTGQDWGAVNVGRSSNSRVTVPKKAADITRLKAQGKLATERKFGAGGNASAHSGANINARKLEETDELKHAKVDKSLSKGIMQARTAKKLTQKQLATAINEKPQVIGEYESGKAIPNPQIIGKLERALGCKLPRPGKKKPAASKSGSTVKAVGGVRLGGTRGPPKRR
mmetsp:Transcript_28398/g.42010  ORF Transcript_28398/g.42010 Transcript_28398/m.42010 type:complete len:174 (+) Transcript_28398:108-629(+)|eukprot:CAMPEP_0195509014 /NCGR_PEP_ID=MMETSP0794_2-20130614/2070_1 /TAXON_ID=515487 /ORGANISM="Stephanopyxis turris, Strain CCMP 815" /LENGTH=173 /DNA_ID=CAMNT_0040636125 /DNA_START=108 /DNA_END=629 /DNA_ORIENTATION=+